VNSKVPEKLRIALIAHDAKKASWPTGRTTEERSLPTYR
jgi:methylglyoxal synthase